MNANNNDYDDSGNQSHLNVVFTDDTGSKNVAVKDVSWEPRSAIQSLTPAEGIRHSTIVVNGMIVFVVVLRRGGCTSLAELQTHDLALVFESVWL